MKHLHLTGQVANEECVHVSINFSLSSSLRDFSHTNVEQLATSLIIPRVKGILFSIRWKLYIQSLTAESILLEILAPQISHSRNIIINLKKWQLNPLASDNVYKMAASPRREMMPIVTNSFWARIKDDMAAPRGKRLTTCTHNNTNNVHILL